MRATRARRLPALQLLLYPVTNFAGRHRSQTLFADGFFLTKQDMDWFRDNYLRGAALDAADPRVSPLLADDLSGLPPALVLTAGFDPLRDEGSQYAEAMRAAGVTVDHRRVRLAGARLRQLLPARRRQRDRDRGDRSRRCGPI